MLGMFIIARAKSIHPMYNTAVNTRTGTVFIKHFRQTTKKGEIS